MDSSEEKQVLVRKRILDVDGGWAWVIAFAGLMEMFLIMCVVRTESVLMVELENTFDTTTAEVSYIITCSGIGSSVGAVLFMFGLADFFHERAILIAAYLLTCSGLIITFFSSRVSQTYAYGFLTGFSADTALVCTMTMVGKYFKKRLAFASGLVGTGAGIATVVFPPFVQWLFDRYAYRGTALIMAAIVLNGVAFASLLRPKDTPDIMRENVPRRGEGIPYKNAPFSTRGEISGIKGNNEVGIEGRVMGDDHEHKINLCTCKRSVKAFVLKPTRGEATRDSLLFTLSFFKEVRFILLVVFVYFSTIGTIGMVQFFPSLTQEQGMTAYQSAFLLSIIGIADLSGRIIFGILGDCNCMKRYKLVTIPVYIMVCACFLSSFATEFWSQALLAVFTGIDNGVLYAMRSVIVVELFGLSTLSRRMGVLGVLHGIGGATAGPLLGYLRNFTGTYTLPITILGVLFFVGASTLLSVALTNCKPHQRNLDNKYTSVSVTSSGMAVDK